MQDKILLETKWKVETLRKIDGSCKRWEKFLTKLPKELDEEFYATWIAFDPMNRDRFWCPWIIFDIDDQTYLEKAQERAVAFIKLLAQEYNVPIKAMRLVFSTSKGFHVYLDSRTIDLQPSALLHRELMAFAKELIPDTDLSLYDKRHVIGLPNTIHRKTKLYYCPLDLYDPIHTWTIEMLRKHADSPREFDSRAEDVEVCPKLRNLFLRVREKGAGRFSLPSSQEVVASLYQSHPFLRGLEQGGRNNGMFRLAAHYRDKMLSKEETKILCDYSNRHSSPPLEEREVIRHIDTAYRKIS